ncbi:unnamed protein product [Rotaria sp. Silwood1]|nr:unnamed protein product [Rotaria sp. Silwood1]CAF1567936.1 unnamed protein product [Rotaria sp. Silwood1]
MSSMDESVLYHLKNLNDHNIISVYKNQFKIGRATTNDLAITNNQYISSCHCTIIYDNGHVYIHDTSSNGTLINRSKKINKNDSPIELHSGDIIHLVFRKDESQSNIIFQLDLLLVTKSKSQIEQILKRKHSDTISSPSMSTNDTKENVEMKRIKINDELTTKVSDDMEDILTCVCCQDIMTNPICLEPCLHAFCNDCYLSWEAIQRTCPKCRVKVTDKKKNVVINGILEAFFKAYPHKRPVLKAIDNRKCKIKTTTNTNIEVGRNTTIYFNNNEMDNDSIDNDKDIILVMNAPISNVQLICRQCPTYSLDRTMNIISTEFQCCPSQTHILCQCCIQPMPDRQDDPNIHQSCEICHQYFCNIYFQQCSRKNCLDFNFAPRHLINLVNDNPIESQIIQNFLTNHNATMRELLIECCRRLDKREFTCTNIDRNHTVPSTKIVCYKCALKIFKELVFQFRISMKQNDILPITMRNRENCYYGKQCRTQYTKVSHAQKYNHACEQTKF